MNEEEIGIGVIGLGMGANRCEMVCHTQGARLVAVADINAERAERIANKHNVEWYTDYHCLLERDDVDVVYIMTPSGLHEEMSVEAAKAGKHVIVTKPIEVTLEKADRMIDECTKKGVKLAVDFEQRYVADNVKIWRAIREGKLGKLILGEVRMKWYRSQEYYEGWHGTWELDGGGSLINQTIHWIDLLQWFMGPVETVFGHTGVFAHKIETEDLGAAILTFRNGAVGTILGTTTYHTDSPPRIEIHGDRGSISTSNNRIELWEFTDGYQPEEIPEGSPQNVVEDMVSALKEDRNPRVSGREGRKSLEIVLAIYRSARTKKVVKLPL
ncbi:MAG TPA: Gfo/Idh/MocA family oxidoreductase [Candidatus Latescibacteria bacterium]|nr:Gfo/Idh/MocA family oxidoreductase [Candidatus Latescibacterota bacterium]